VDERGGADLVSEEVGVGLWERKEEKGGKGKGKRIQRTSPARIDERRAA
jgi:hypothetical protein